MDPRQACLDCLAQEPPALFEAALWIAAEHLPAYSPAQSLRELDELVRQIGASLDDRASASERAQGLLRRMSEQGFCEDDDFPLQPRSALLPLVLQRRQGQPLSLALVAMELARRLDIPLVGVNFPGRFLLRVPVLGDLVRTINVSRFARTLGTMLQSGVPMLRALDELDAQAWIAGLRRQQAKSRSGLSVALPRNGRLKVHPIIDWTDRDVGLYLRRHDLPYHPLWEHGYVSIGDVHTTSRLADGMSEEDTRFFGLKRECGLHEHV